MVVVAFGIKGEEDAVNVLKIIITLACTIPVLIYVSGH